MIAALIGFIAIGLTACDSSDQPATTAPPVSSAVVVVLGEEVTGTEPDEIRQIILDRLFANYRQTHGIEATDAEVEGFVRALQRGMAADQDLTGEDDLTKEEQSQVREMREAMARELITQWRINRSLYDEYGGRVIAQQFGAEPLDAYREFLEAQQQAGAFTINDEDMRQYFWKYFRDESIHDFLPADMAAKAFSTPPWEQLAQ